MKFQRLLTIAALLLFAGPASAQGFTHGTGCKSGQTSSATPSCALGTTPVKGTVLVVSGFSVGATTMTASDGMYAYCINAACTGAAANCETTYSSSAGTECFAYLICQAATCGATVTATFNATSNNNIWVDPYTVSGGSAAVAATGIAASLPTITPSATKDLIYDGTSVTGNITGLSGAWTGVTGAIVEGNDSEYQIAPSSAQTAAYAGSLGNTDCVWLDFTFAPTTPTSTCTLAALGAGPC